LLTPLNASVDLHRIEKYFPYRAADRAATPVDHRCLVLQ